MAANYELRISDPGGTTRVYEYPDLAGALGHAVQVAATDPVERIEVWRTEHTRIFTYKPAPESRRVAMEGGEAPCPTSTTAA